MDHFGDIGSKIYLAVKLVSELVLGISKVIFLPGEGYTWGFFHWFKKEGEWPGNIRVCSDVPKWVRGNLVAFREYLDYLDKHPWDEDVVNKINNGRKGPLKFLDEITQKAKDGLEKLKTCYSKVPDENQTDFNILLQSAAIAYYTGIEWQHRLLARLYYGGIQDLSDKKVRRKLADQCLSELREAKYALFHQLEAGLKFPEGFMDFTIRLGLHRGNFYPHSVSRRLKLMDEEHEDLEKEFEMYKFYRTGR